MTLSDLKVAVVGAGVAGITAARTLLAKSVSVRVFEAGPEMGGRLSTPEMNGVRVDWGSQMIQMRTPGFQREAQSLLDSGILKQWKPKFGVIREQNVEPYYPPEKVYVGVPGNASILRHWADNVDVELNSKIQSMRQDGSRWILQSSGREIGPFDQVLLCIPPGEVQKIESPQFGFSSEVRSVSMASTWTVVVDVEGGESIPYEAAYIQKSPLVWVARNDSKPGRESKQCLWVLQSSHDWAKENNQMDPEMVSHRLGERMRHLPFMSRISIRWSKAHFWSESTAVKTLKPRFLWDQFMKVGCAGDWLGMAQIEGAYLSGLGLAFQAMKGT